MKKLQTEAEKILSEIDSVAFELVKASSEGKPVNSGMIERYEKALSDSLSILSRIDSDIEKISSGQLPEDFLKNVNIPKYIREALGIENIHVQIDFAEIEKSIENSFGKIDEEIREIEYELRKREIYSSVVYEKKGIVAIISIIISVFLSIFHAISHINIPNEYILLIYSILPFVYFYLVNSIQKDEIERIASEELKKKEKLKMRKKG